MLRDDRMGVGPGHSDKDKTSKYTNPCDDRSQGYGFTTRNGFCPCGAPLSSHEDGKSILYSYLVLFLPLML